MDNCDLERKTSTPLRPGCKRLSNTIETSPILWSHSVKRSNIEDNLMYDSDDIFQELLGEDNLKKICKEKLNKEDTVKNNLKNKLVSKVSNSLQFNESPTGLSLLSVDDSFLKCFDLSSIVPNKKIICESNCDPVESASNCNCVKGCSNSLLCENVTEDDHAWDMSISAEINHDYCDKSRCNNSQEMYGSFLSESVKWDGQSIIDTFISNGNTLNNVDNEKHSFDNEKSSFGDKIKTILLNNAQKPMIKISQGKLSLNNTQESISSVSSAFFGLPPVVRSLIKKYKGIHQLYGKFI